MTEEELVALEHASTTHAGLPASDVSDLIAEVRRLLALPIIETCGMCARLEKDCGGYHCGGLWMVEGESGYSYIECGKVDWQAEPPAWCPLKAQQNQRDVK